MWGRFTKSGLQLESVLQEPLRTDVCKTWVSAVAFLVSSHSWTTDSVRSVSPGLKTKRTGLLLSGPKFMFSDESKFCISFGNQGPRVWRKRGEAQNPRCLRSSVKFSTVSDGLGCHVICWCWSTVLSEFKVNTAVYQEVLEHFMLPAADQLYEMQISFSNRTWHLHTVPKLPVPGLRTMVSLFLIGQQTRLTLTP